MTWCLVALLHFSNCWACAEAEKPRIQVAEKKHVDFLVGEQLIGRYQIGAVWAKPHMYPLYGPYQKPITRHVPASAEDPQQPKDHPHQKSVWFCHGDVVPEGIELKTRVRNVEGVDFWSETPGHGRIVCVFVGQPQTDNNQAWIETRNEWRTADGVKILDETRTIRLYNLGESKLLVFEIELHASVAPIRFADTKEGGFGVRVADSMSVDAGGTLVNAEGNKGEGARNNAERKGCWGLRSAWCDYSGSVDGKLVGLAVFDDPKNPYPAYWHARNYGLLAANLFGRAKAQFPGVPEEDQKKVVRLAKDERLKLRYGLLIHPGSAADAKTAECFEQFQRLR
jgi:hypothetical protein